MVGLFAVPAFADDGSGFPDGTSSPLLHTDIAFVSGLPYGNSMLSRKGTALETCSYVRLTSHSSAGCRLCSLSWMRFCKPGQVPYGFLTRIAVLLYGPKSGLCSWYSTVSSLLGGTGDQMPIAGADSVRPPVTVVVGTDPVFGCCQYDFGRPVPRKEGPLCRIRFCGHWVCCVRLLNVSQLP